MRALLAAAVVASALGLAACGGKQQATTPTAPIAANEQDKQAQTHLRNAMMAAEECYTDQQTYVGCDLAQVDPTLKLPKQLAYKPFENGYRIELRSASGTTFSVQRDEGGTTRGCSAAGRGACLAGGTW